MALSTKINRVAAKLMDDYRLPDICYSSLIVNDEVFAILADLDQLQANLAGSEVWRGAASADWMNRLSDDARSLAARSQRAGLGPLSTRLNQLSEALDKAKRGT